MPIKILYTGRNGKGSVENPNWKTITEAIRYWRKQRWSADCHIVRITRTEN